MGESLPDHSWAEEDAMLYHTLSNGMKMPSLGLGTWLHGDTGNQMRDAVVEAVDMGYRHIDCAYIYLNEKKIGEAFATIFEKGDVKREDLFITSKLWGTEHAGDRVEAACRSSLSDLGLEYFDLYLIHWPTGFVPDNGNLPKDEEGRLRFSGVSIEETWTAMEKLVDLGLTKAIGLSNFNSKQIRGILDTCRIPPTVLQVESNPRFNNEALRRFCKKKDITMVGYSPFGSPDLPWGEKMPHLLIDPTLVRIAAEHDKSTALICLRWQLQRGVGAIPKSIIKEELENNLEIEGWELTPEQCKEIDGLNTGKRKIVPIVVLKDGTTELRDKGDINNPFENFEEPLEDEE